VYLVSIDSQILSKAVIARSLAGTFEEIDYCLRICHSAPFLFLYINKVTTFCQE